ncbi:MAG: D-alanyl-D-alanine carboxypeptidase [Burkholderiales bacterium]|uniref:D-alanyl-D-alanine carboxypeptidase family protein n=1 Tax=Nitrosomonas sp. TaxID=42353 RepID=UPI001DDBA69D|nr:D-alanyl-D-alanine carboxypeptidase family protein [Nitrosomonas sp.]MCB1949802.1 D-alanyl-D-alanine carboxypeptidase [Nitrosomonas sp.]MCP5242870.1 D-alanyl-D-alanine carboxypeptidase [Burkholderiales bacterium]
MFDLKLTGIKGLVVLVVLVSVALVGRAHANPRYASIVINADTGAVLHESNADASRYPASLTKMMTLYMLFEAMQQGKMTLDSRMPVSVHAASMPQTNIGLRAGETLSVRDAIPALIVRSANDAAAVVAEALGRTESNFGRLMTEKARQMGMHSTIFRNASGLPDRAQITTARDMVKLSVRLMKDFPQYYPYFSTQSFRYRGITYNSHNRMVRNTHGVDGLKTGFIRASGFNVATSAKRDERRLIAVVMGGKTAASRDQHTVKLLDRSFKKATPAQLVASSNHTSDTTHSRSNSLTDAPIPAAKPIVSLTGEPDPAAILRGEFMPVSDVSENSNLPKSNSWAVQIGSYFEPSRAHAQAQAATRWVAGEVAVVEVEISNRIFYRARVVGLQKNQAFNACQSLSRNGMDCMVVRS